MIFGIRVQYYDASDYMCLRFRLLSALRIKIFAFKGCFFQFIQNVLPSIFLPATVYLFKIVFAPRFPRFMMEFKQNAIVSETNSPFSAWVTGRACGLEKISHQQSAKVLL